jgi:hypothetical protein
MFRTSSSIICYFGQYEEAEGPIPDAYLFCESGKLPDQNTHALLVNVRKSKAIVACLKDKEGHTRL